MKIRRTFCVCLAVVFALLACFEAQAGVTEEKKVENAIEVITEIMDIPEQSVPPSLLRDAYAIAVIPGVIKVGFVLGGRYGRGIMVVRTKGGGWSNPSFVTITGGSIGWQIGVQAIDIILVFKSEESTEGVTRGKFTLGVDAEVAAGPVGRHLEAATDAQLKAEIYSYSRSKGLFLGISIEGAALSIDHDSNEDFYGVKGISAADILGGKKLKVPVVAKKFKQVLSEEAAAPEKE